MTIMSTGRLYVYVLCLVCVCTHLQICMHIWARGGVQIISGIFETNANFNTYVMYGINACIHVFMY